MESMHYSWRVAEYSAPELSMGGNNEGRGENSTAVCRNNYTDVVFIIFYVPSQDLKNFITLLLTKNY